MLKNSLIMLKKCTYNSQYIAHYAQVELTIMLIMTWEDLGLGMSEPQKIAYNKPAHI